MPHKVTSSYILLELDTTLYRETQVDALEDQTDQVEDCLCLEKQKNSTRSHGETALADDHLLVKKVRLLME